MARTAPNRSGLSLVKVRLSWAWHVTWFGQDGSSRQGSSFGEYRDVLLRFGLSLGSARGELARHLARPGKVGAGLSLGQR